MAPKLVLVAKEWKPRALARAQLLEEGFEVTALDTLEDAIYCIESKLRKPRLLIYENSGELLDQAALDKLRRARQLGTEVLLCVGTADRERFDREEFKHFMVRPYSIGELLETVKSLVL